MKWITIIGVLAIGLLASQEAGAFYNASTGRWLSRDPLQELAGLNLNAFARNNPITLIDKFGLCTPGCNRAGCVVRVVPAGYSPNTSETLDELATLYVATEYFGLLVASGEAAAASMGSIEEAVATGIGKCIDHGITSPGKVIAEAAKGILEKLGAHNGWTAWIKVFYQSCEKRCLLGRKTHLSDGYWKDLAGSKDWEAVTGELPISESFLSSEEALKAGSRRCDEKTAGFREKNKICDCE